MQCSSRDQGWGGGAGAQGPTPEHAARDAAACRGRGSKRAAGLHGVPRPPQRDIVTCTRFISLRALETHLPVDQSLFLCQVLPKLLFQLLPQHFGCVIRGVSEVPYAFRVPHCAVRPTCGGFQIAALQQRQKALFDDHFGRHGADYSLKRVQNGQGPGAEPSPPLLRPYKLLWHTAALYPTKDRFDVLHGSQRVLF